VEAGRVTLNYRLFNNTDRTIGFDPAKKRPVDRDFPDKDKRIPPQDHF